MPPSPIDCVREYGPMTIPGEALGPAVLVAATVSSSLLPSCGDMVGMQCSVYRAAPAQPANMGREAYLCAPDVAVDALPPPVEPACPLCAPDAAAPPGFAFAAEPFAPLPVSVPVA